MTAAREVGSPTETLLSRLDHVQRHGRGYRANCPRGHSSRGALSIAVGDDNRVLIKCFAGCEVTDVLAAVGLTISDLFPRQERRDMPPAERARVRELVAQSHWRAALGVLAREASVIEVAATMIQRSESLAIDDFERVHVAALRIRSAREVLQ